MKIAYFRKNEWQWVMNVNRITLFPQKTLKAMGVKNRSFRKQANGFLG